MATTTFKRRVVVVDLRNELEGEVLVAELLVGAAADVVLVQTDLGREADQRPVSRLHVVGVEAPAVNGGKRADVRNQDKIK